MHIIKLNATDSTNTYLRELGNNNKLKDYTAVIADYQTDGRGQMGTNWSSEKSKNLIISIYKNLDFLNIDNKFGISMVVSISIVEAIKNNYIRNLCVKWPNDIMADNHKIGGILIENIVKTGKVKATIIGIGLNLNQTNFKDIPRATSLRLLTGKSYNTEEIAHSIIAKLKINFDKLKNEGFEEIKSQYLKIMFRKDKPSTFKNYKNDIFTGYIKGVSGAGKLQVLLEDSIVEEYDLKEISLLF